MEVGANSRNLLSANEAACRGYEDVFILSFEPLLNHYCALSHAKRADSRSELGMLDGGRGYALPFAVASSAESYAELGVTRVDGCSGLLTPNKQQSVDGYNATFVPW